MSGCEMWKRSFADHALQDDKGGDHEGIWLSAHERGCAACAREARAWRSWRARHPSPAAEDAQVRHVVQAFLASPALAQLHKSRWNLRWLWLAAPVCAGFALAIVAVALPRAKPPAAVVVVQSEPPRLVMASADAGGEHEILRAGARLASGATLRAGAGRLCFTMDQGVLVCLAAGATAQIADTDVAHRKVHLLTGLAVAWLHPQAQGTSFSISTDDGTVTAVGTNFAVHARDTQTAASVRLFHGAVALTARNGSTGRLVNRGTRLLPDLSEPTSDTTPADLPAMLELGGLLPTEAAASPPARLDVSTSSDEGEVFVDDRAFGRGPLSLLLPPGRHRLRIERGAQVLRDEVTLGAEDAVVRSYTFDAVAAAEAPKPTRLAHPSRSTAAPDGAQMLMQARTLRAAGDFAAAAKVYQKLRRVHPHSQEARLGLVLLGDLQLSHLHQPQAALRSFEAYIHSGDQRLASEAAYGRIKALTALGRHAEQARAEREFLQRFPQSLQAGTLRPRVPSTQNTP